MLFFGKENVFMCLVAFQKIFRKIFSSVWKRRRKRQTQKNKDKTQKKKSSTIDWVRRRGASRAPVWRLRCRSRSTARSHEGEIVIFARSRSTSRDCNRRRDLAKRLSRSRIAVFGLELARSARIGARGSPAIVRLDWSSVFFLSRARSLSLSLFFRKYFKVKMKV